MRRVVLLLRGKRGGLSCLGNTSNVYCLSVNHGLSHAMDNSLGLGHRCCLLASIEAVSSPKPRRRRAHRLVILGSLKGHLKGRLLHLLSVPRSLPASCSSGIPGHQRQLVCQSLDEVRICSENEAIFERILLHCRIHSLI